MFYEADDKGTLKAEVRRGPSYNFKEVMGGEGVYVQSMPHGYISDLLGNEYMNWTPEVPVGIFADTGSGKNHFVEKVLIPAAQFFGKRVLLFSNRNALGRQEKLRLAELFNEGYKLEKYSDKGVDELTEIGCLTVVSYQQLEAWVNTGSSKLEVLTQEFHFVVCDECHYFVADCKFNAMTDLSLGFITENFAKAVRIYMTATPEDVLPVILANEGDGGCIWNGRYAMDGYRFHAYLFKHCFSQYCLHAFTEVGDIVPKLKAASKTEKAVVFVDSKDVGASIVQLCGAGTLLTAESKENDGPGHEVYDEIVKKEKTGEHLLVCTAVLENGINIKDRDVKTVILFSNEKSRFLQMLGRIRCEEDQVLDVFIADISEEQIRKLLNSLQKQLVALKLFCADPTAFAMRYIIVDEPIAYVKGCFTIKNNRESHVNSLRLIQIEHMEIPFWTKVLNDMETDPYALLREKYSWLEEEFNAKTLLVPAGHDRGLFNLILFLEGRVNKQLDKNAQEAFKEEFSELYKRVYGCRDEDKTKDQIYGLNIIKQCLEKAELPYILDSNRGNWCLVHDETVSF